MKVTRLTAMAMATACVLAACSKPAADKTADALREFFVELESIRKPVSDEELAKAKNYVALGFPSEFETSGRLAQKMEELIVYNLPDDTFENFTSKVGAVTTAEVARAAAQYIQPERMAVVVVGDLKAIQPEIAAS